MALAESTAFNSSPLHYLFAGFSLAAWQIAEGVANTFPIDPSVVDNLLSDLNVAALISYPACSPTDSEYANAMTNLQKCMNHIYIQFVLLSN